MSTNRFTHGISDLKIYDERIEIVNQQIEFERTTFGHAYPEGDSKRVRYLQDDIRVLLKQRAELALFMRKGD